MPIMEPPKPPFDLFDELWPIGVPYQGGRGCVVINTDWEPHWGSPGVVRVMNEAGVVFSAAPWTHYVLARWPDSISSRDVEGSLELPS
jgi:hypothetical protein